MKKILIAAVLISGLFYSTAIIAQTIDSETIIIDDKNKESKTVIEIEDGEVFIDGKKVSDLSKNDGKIKIIKQKTFIQDNINEFPFDAPLLFQSNKAMLGVRTQNANPGAEILEVMPNTAAEKAGLKKGDIITAVNDDEIQTAAELSQVIKKYKAGEVVELKIESNHQELAINATLGKSEDKTVRVFEGDNFPEVFKNFNLEQFMPHNESMFRNQKPTFGMTVEEADQGLRVIDIKEGSIAEKSGLEVNDVILQVEQEEVNSPADFKKAALQNSTNNKFKIKVERNQRIKTLSMEIPKMRRRAEL